ncbi:MAG: hypothetical protein ABR499_18795 [Gemmatimonadaceae bacterium]
MTTETFTPLVRTSSKSDSSNPGRLAEQIARVTLGLPLATAPATAALTPPERARYVGT